MAAKEDFKIFKSTVDPVYRNNFEYLQLSEQEMDQLFHLIKALKRSNVAKVCKDKFHLKRRLPFKMNDEIKKEIEECTIYVENFPHNFELRELFKPYGIRDLRLKQHKDVQYAFIELKSKEAALTTQQDLHNTVPSLFRIIKN